MSEMIAVLNCSGSNNPLTNGAKGLQSINDLAGSHKELILWIIVVILVGFGLLLNLLAIGSIFTAKRNGTHYLLLQIIIADLLSLSQFKFDLFYVWHRSWFDSIELCPYYLGIDALANTAVVFFIVTFNFHTVSTYNLIRKTMEKTKEQQLEDCNETESFNDSDLDDSFDDSEPSDHGSKISTEFQRNAHRSITIDYSKPKTKVPVLQPIVFIWLLAVSISVPLFLFGRIVPNLNRSSNERMCGLVVSDQKNSVILQILLINMRIIIPMVCLVLTTVWVIFKLWQCKQIKYPNWLSAEDFSRDELKQTLKLALSLSITYIICSLQRTYGSVWFELLSRPMMEFKYIRVHTWCGAVGCILHYMSILLRPLLYISFQQKIRIALKRLCCFCRRRY